jgi:predicted PurR-regulated permease PerM
MKTFTAKIAADVGNPPDAPTGSRRRFKRVMASRTRHFIQHFFEMCITMCLGQGVLVALIIVEAGLTGFFHLLSQYPWSVGFILAMSMIVPMAAWTISQ